jgi:hypothetical protein
LLYSFFQDTEFVYLTADAVRNNPICKPEIATDVVLKRVISSWLINSRDRQGGRRRRLALTSTVQLLPNRSQQDFEDEADTE